ncbi:hypothetical protein LXM60_19760 [Pandoraea sputorum]|uniref:hypothetical protein n=1 Tax=Pandoraea sputorum TaxID=93222 RepID=UPI001E55BD26|nr:hypothetical protein [Pandoraea sputorum]MCE4062441.1 hypothetical protein [Pandoraea sputorum]
MNTIRRSGLSADAFGSLSERSTSYRRDTATVSQARNNGRAECGERDERAFSLTGEPAACVTGLLQGLGELITRSPSADAARRAGKADARRRDQPAVVMPSRVRERTAGAALRPAGHGDG